MRIPGYVMRQSLVDEIQKRLDEKLKELSTTTDQLAIVKITGQISALEDMSKWAINHSAPSLSIERC